MKTVFSSSFITEHQYTTSNFQLFNTHILIMKSYSCSVICFFSLMLIGLSQVDTAAVKHQSVKVSSNTVNQSPTTSRQPINIILDDNLTWFCKFP